MPPAGGKRYLTSTAVFLVEVVKLAISLTMALYNVSKTAPPSMPATSLFFSLTSAVFSGDSWKMAIPAGLDVLSNSLLYIALSNLRAATFQVTFQLKFLTTAIFGLMLLRRSIPPRKWGLLLLLVVGVALVQIPDASTEQMLQDDHANHYFPRSLEEWKAVKQGSGSGSSLHKRSATYEGIEEDILTADPHLNPTIGLLATIGAALASGLASIYFEKVLKDSSNQISLWVRNVQLAVYSIFPALFIGIVFRDGEKIAEDGFFQGYNWAVWSTIVIQALGGIVSAFYVSHAQKDARSLTTTVNIILSIIGSIWLFDFEVTASVCPLPVQFLLIDSLGLQGLAYGYQILTALVPPGLGCSPGSNSLLRKPKLHPHSRWLSPTSNSRRHLRKGRPRTRRLARGSLIQRILYQASKHPIPVRWHINISPYFTSTRPH